MIWISDDSEFKEHFIWTIERINVFARKKLFVTTLKLARVIEWHHHTGNKTIQSQKLYYQLSNQIASFKGKRLIASRFFSAMTWVNTVLDWESDFKDEKKKSPLKAERIYRSKDKFHLVCTGKFVDGVKKIVRHSVKKVFLSAAFNTSYMYVDFVAEILRFFEIFDIKLSLIVFLSAIELNLFNQSVILVEFPFKKCVKSF